MTTRISTSMKVLITAFAMVMAFPSLGSAASAIYQPTLDRLVVFVVGSNGHLFDKYWSGSAWVWEDQGLPPGESRIENPSAVYQPTLDRIVVFVQAVDPLHSESRLYDKYWDGSAWVWEFQGNGPPIFPGTMSAIDQPTHDYDQIHLFVKGASCHLYDLHWNGSAWVWDDTGLPFFTPGCLFYPAAVYQPTLDRLVVFVQGRTPRTARSFYSYLFDTYWNGNAWVWDRQGQPPGEATDDTPKLYKPTAVHQPTLDRLVVFLVDKNRDGYFHLYDKYWSGTAWVWEDHGLLPGVTSDSISDPLTPSAVYQSAQDRIVVFLPSNNGHLYEFDKYWDGGSGGVWQDQGIPPGAVSIWGTSAVYQPPIDRLVVFVEGYDRFGAHHLYDKYWDGSSWIWEDQGYRND